MSRRRVVITGLGVITSLGETVDEMWENVCAGKSGIGPITRWDTSQVPRPLRRRVHDVRRRPSTASTCREAKRLDRFGQFGMAASRQRGEGRRASTSPRKTPTAAA